MHRGRKELQLTPSVWFFQDELVRELKQTLNAIKLEEKGVYVQASTLGSLEALLEFLRTSKVPVSIHLDQTYTLKGHREKIFNPEICVCVCLCSMQASTLVQSTKRT